MDQFWADTIDRLTFAFQPVLSCRDGRIMGVEALLRGHREAGFRSIPDVFDLAYNDRKLAEVDSALREKSLRLFSLLPLSEDVKLFSNLDNRVFSRPEGRSLLVPTVLNRVGLDPDRLVLEISERHSFEVVQEDFGGMGLALDDFGTGYSGLETLWRIKPAYLKIDRFFVTGLESDPAKQSFLEGMIDLGRRVGAVTIVEGVETRGELEACLRSGCDAVQGFAVGLPAFNGEPFRGISFDRQGLLFPLAAAKLGG
jgi:EAL domain-containing protein (putative c-di-GMP-specific phosphodiesterase class I)